MAIKQKRLTKKGEAEIERLRRLIKENDERLRSNVTAKGDPLTQGQQDNLREIINTQRNNLNAITNHLDGETDAT